MKKAMEALLAFRDSRDWAQFHNPKDLAIAISTEANELLAEYLWKSAGDVDVEKVKDEIADVLSYCLLIASHYGLDPETIILEKVARNEIRYPIEKSRGSAKKYNEL
jgi:NTP pyrophosphatase (non-canonical NTP hydrolase)